MLARLRLRPVVVVWPLVRTVLDTLGVGAAACIGRPMYVVLMLDFPCAVYVADSRGPNVGGWHSSVQAGVCFT